MKSILTFGLCISFFLVGQLAAQKIDREKLGYFNYLQPPASTVLEDDAFYLLLIELEDKDAYRRQLAEQKFKAGKFKQADTDNPYDFTIRITEGAFNYGSSKKNTTSEKYTVDKVEKTRAIYYYKGDVRYHYTLKVINNNGEEIFREDATGTTTMTGDRSESLSLAHDNYVKQKVKVKEEILMEQVQRLNDIFNNQYATVEKTVHLTAIRIKEKKYDYPLFNQAFEDIERAYNILKTASAPTAESDEKLKGAVHVYTSFVKGATPNEGKSKKNNDVTAAAYYNLGIAYFLVQDYANATTNFNMAASFDDKIVYDVSHLSDVSETLAQRYAMQQNGDGILKYLGEE